MLHALAAEYTINTNLPGSLPDPATGVAGMINSAYIYLLSIAGAIAFLSIVYAGIQWALSQGNPGKTGDAKDRIWAAFYGIALLFGAYIILAAVNPSLTFLRMPELKPISLPDVKPPGIQTRGVMLGGCRGATWGNCPSGSGLECRLDKKSNQHSCVPIEENHTCGTRPDGGTCPGELKCTRITATNTWSCLDTLKKYGCGNKYGATDCPTGYTCTEGVAGTKSCVRD